MAAGLQPGYFMRHHLALVACLAFTGSFADAAPGRHAGRHRKAAKKKVKHKKVAPPVEQPDSDDARADDDSERVALSETIDALGDEDEIDDEDELDAPVRVREVAKARAKKWHVVFGPYLWASSVDAEVSLGSQSVSAGVDFMDIKRHAKYGIELLAEARYDRFSIYEDLLYGVVGVGGATEVGPLMVKLHGTASSLLVERLGGYMLAGGDHSWFSLEARAGVRYQRTAISGSVNVALQLLF